MSAQGAVVLALASATLAGQHGPAPSAARPPAALELQVLLDRAGYSPGEIDGVPGSNTRKAAAAFAASRGLPASPDDPRFQDALGAGRTPATAIYLVTAEDAAGPFIDTVPDDMMAKATLLHLSYTSLVEALAERFHASPELLAQLNPGVPLGVGVEIVVPNVAGTFVAPASAAEVIVSRAESTLVVLDAAGRVIFFAPVTSGSEHDPLPLGGWTVTGISRNPTFNYNPSLFWDADPAHAKAKIPAGPNGPVGVVWIDLTKDHYGLHGTPEPGRIGHSASHGCVRLTNWDATTVADLVTAGTPVRFEP